MIIKILAMKKIYILTLLLIFSSGNVFAQNGWFQLKSPTNRTIYTVCFVNTDNGYIGTDSGKVYKTVNGGINWILISIPTTNPISKIFFVNPNIGYLYSGNYGNALYKSTNSGLNWNELTIQYNKDPKDIYFININTGYIANHLNILKTTDGGVVWDTLKPELPGIGHLIQYYGVYFKNLNTGFVVGAHSFYPGFHNRVIWRTINGGQNWSRVNTLSGCDYLRISFLNEDIGYSVGACSYISKTTNGGDSWNPVNLNLPSYYPVLSAVSIINPNKVFTCGSWGLYNTNNGGINWSLAQIPYASYRQISFPDSLTGYITGEAGRIYKTTTGGATTSIEPINSNIPKHSSLSQNHPNPFNPITKIKFDIPKQSNAKIIIYDLLGQEITTLVNEQLKPGSYEVDWNGSNFASGVYFYSLVTDEFVETKRMVLIK
jgi:photosystem II stability/assembly factor-like uncharacterized protein